MTGLKPAASMIRTNLQASEPNGGADLESAFNTAQPPLKLDSNLEVLRRIENELKVTNSLLRGLTAPKVRETTESSSEAQKSPGWQPSSVHPSVYRRPVDGAKAVTQAYAEEGLDDDATDVDPATSAILLPKNETAIAEEAPTTANAKKSRWSIFGW